MGASKKSQLTGSGSLRVIAGIYRGRRLRTLAGSQTRPTSDRLRETFFNIVSPWVKGAVFLDLCAGSGAIGIEALSRGASRAVFVEISRTASAIIDENLCHVDADRHAAIVTQDVISALKLLAARNQAFDLIYFDPPYDSNLYDPVIGQIASSELLRERGLLIVEHQSRRALEESYGGLTRYREVRQGNSALAFYRRDSSNLQLILEAPARGSDNV